MTDGVLDLLPLIAFGVLGALAMMAFLASRLWQRAPRVLPADATLMQTLRQTPFALAVFLDLNDLVLDFFGAPIAWLVAGRLGLDGLKRVAVVEALIPGTQVLPTFTVLWLVARVVPRGRLSGRARGRPSDRSSDALSARA